MRILQITNKIPYPDTDGGSIATLNLTKGISSLGHEVTILSMITLKHSIKHEEIPEEIRKLAHFILVDVPAPVTWQGALKNLLLSRVPYNAERFISKNFIKEIISLLQKKEFDIIQLEGLYVCPYIETIRKNSKALIVYRAHNIESEIWERTVSLSKGLKKWYLKILSRRLRKLELAQVNSYDAVVPITSRDGDILQKSGNIKPMFISQTGIDISKLVPDKKDMEHPSIFHIGSLEWSPNQEGLFWFMNKCWGKLMRKYPTLKFYIAGRHAPDWFIKKIKHHNVVFLGEIDDAYSFMNSKSIMVVPLFAGSGMRIKIIEGMALGKSIVSTSIGTEGISTTHGKNILIANNEDEFIHAISELIENKALFEKTGLNAIRYIHDNFNNLVIAEKLISFFKKQLGWDS